MLFAGKLGISQQMETAPGVWEEVITEHEIRGTLEQKTDTLTVADEVLPRHTTTTSVSVFARSVGPRDNSDLRYVTHAGKKWTIRSIVDKPPKIVLFFGEEYRGPTPGGTA